MKQQLRIAMAVLLCLALGVSALPETPQASGPKAQIRTRPTTTAPAPARSPALAAPPLPSLAKQLALGVKQIVLDPGHGGKDSGAISCHGIAEKDLTLAFAKLLKKQLETRLGCKVLLTRTHDRFLSLEDRARVANNAKADLFISVHANAHLDPALAGFETFSLNFARDQESARVAALENATSRKAMSDLKPLLEKLLRTTKINESAALASQVQRNTVAKLRAKGDKVRDLGVKQAPFHVLLGAQMPSVLIEIGFLTNQEEEKRLKTRQYQQNLVAGITAGVESYLMETKKVAKAGVR